MDEPPKMTFRELRANVERLRGITDEQRNEIICSLIGHSNVIDNCFGYVHCARCNAQIGDTLGGVYRNGKAVVVGHNCPTCQENFEQLTWRDKLFVKNPLHNLSPFENKEELEAMPFLLTFESEVQSDE